MLLPVVTDAIKQSPKHIAGISFSDRSIRFIEVERHKEGVLTLSSFGQLTIPYDVMDQGRVINMVEFTEMVRRLNNSLHKNARVILREDADPHKIEALLFAGYGDIYTKKGIDSLRGVFVPWESDVKRICLFANYDMTYVLEITGYETKLLGKITKQELFSPGTGTMLRSHIAHASDDRVLLAGKYEDETYTDQLDIYGITIEESSIWKNLFDFSRYIPEIPQDEAYQYTVPAGLVVAGLMGDVLSVVKKPNINKQKKSPSERVVAEVDPKKTSQDNAVSIQSNVITYDKGGLADFLSDVDPLTKLDEDKRKASEKRLPRKYSKMLS